MAEGMQHIVPNAEVLFGKTSCGSATTTGVGRGESGRSRASRERQGTGIGLRVKQIAPEHGFAQFFPGSASNTISLAAPSSRTSKPSGFIEQLPHRPPHYPLGRAPSSPSTLFLLQESTLAKATGASPALRTTIDSGVMYRAIALYVIGERAGGGWATEPDRAPACCRNHPHRFKTRRQYPAQ